MTREQGFALALVLLGSAILGPLAKLFWDWVFQKRAKLLATVEAHRYETPDALKEVLKKALGSSLPLNDPLRDEVMYWGRVSGFAEMVLTNNSKKRINNISIIVQDRASGFYRVGDRAAERMSGSKKFEVGDLQPGHTVKISFWPTSDWSNTYKMLLKNQFKISADELDRVSFQYPSVRYQRGYYLVPKWIANISGFLVWLAFIVWTFSK